MRSVEKHRHEREYFPLDRARYVHNDRVIFEPVYGECGSDESERNCKSWSKYAIYGFNIIFMVVGTATLGLGAWLRTDSRFRDFLSERYRQVVHEAFWEAPTLYMFSYILIVLGASMIVVAVFGCCGATQESQLLLGLYGAATFLLLIFTIGCGAYILYKKDGIDVELSDALNYMVQHYYQGPSIIQESLDHLQQAFRCCGNAGCSDFRVFRQDPPRTCDIRCDGCHYRIWLALRIGLSVAIAVFSIVIIAQLVAISISFALAFGNDTNRQRRANYRIPPYSSPRYQWTNGAYQYSPPPQGEYIHMQKTQKKNNFYTPPSQRQNYY